MPVGGGEPVMDAKLLRRLGTIEITDAFLTPEGIHQIGHIFLKFFPLSARYDITRGMFIITGCSPELAEVPEGNTPPIVAAQMLIEHNRTISAKLVPFIRNPEGRTTLQILDDLQMHYANQRAGIKDGEHERQ